MPIGSVWAGPGASATGQKEAPRPEGRSRTRPLPRNRSLFVAMALGERGGIQRKTIAQGAPLSSATMRRAVPWNAPPTDCDTTRGSRNAQTLALNTWNGGVDPPKSRKGSIYSHYLPLIIHRYDQPCQGDDSSG